MYESELQAQLIPTEFHPDFSFLCQRLQSALFYWLTSTDYTFLLVDVYRLHFSTGQSQRSSSRTAFFSVNCRLHFSSRPEKCSKCFMKTFYEENYKKDQWIFEKVLAGINLQPDTYLLIYRQSPIFFKAN